MKSPFPGMDPYLEGRLWPDLHKSLGVAIRNQLSATIDARYSIRLETSVESNEDPQEELGLMVPDVLVDHLSDQPVPLPSGSVATIAPRLTVPAPSVARVTSVRIRLARERTLVTSIEIISPANKHGASFEKFRQKWSTLRRAGVSLVEIDLIRRGRRIFPQPELNESPYLVTITRSSSGSTGAWPIHIREKLPLIPIPLLSPDPDAPIDLQELFELVWVQARYANDVDYSVPPPPPALSPEDEEWARELIAAARLT